MDFESLQNRLRKLQDNKIGLKTWLQKNHKQTDGVVSQIVTKNDDKLMKIYHQTNDKNMANNSDNHDKQMMTAMMTTK